MVSTKIIEKMVLKNYVENVEIFKLIIVSLI
jgi:hypothetical protein